jgi:hypothetical protein
MIGDMRTRDWMAVSGLVAALGACGGTEGPGTGPGDSGQIAVQGGNAQTATVASSLAPYQVLVTDLGGAPKPGVAVFWTVVSGGGTIPSPNSISDANGLASATATLGSVAGVQTVHASAPGYTGSPVTFASTATADVPTAILRRTGNAQNGGVGDTLALPLEVRVVDQFQNGVPGTTVAWTVASGGGTVTAPATITDQQGITQVRAVMPDSAGTVMITAAVQGLGQTVSFTATALRAFAVVGGGNNVPERYGSDLWVAEGYGYSGTWGFRGQSGNAVKIWQLNQAGAPTLVNTITVPNIGTVSDVEVSPDGDWLVFTAEGGAGAGLHVYELTSPGTPVFRASLAVSSGLHTGTLAVIGGKLYAFTAKNPGSPALNIYDLSQAGAGTITPAGSYPIPPFYGIHDTFVRDGYAFVFAWDEGLYILDVGNGSHGGSPAAPMLVSHTGDHNNPSFGGQTHNGWWFHNPTNGQKRYLFIGEEGPGVVGSSSSGDIHVVDVSDLANPVEVAFYRLNGAGAHNLWMDEPNQRLYAAFYNGGVVALDVSGVLSGDLASREIARIQPGGAGNTYVWGVMLSGGFLYASDMISGFWQLSVP